jgi:hypothetical protein
VRVACQITLFGGSVGDLGIWTPLFGKSAIFGGSEAKLADFRPLFGNLPFLGLLGGSGRFLPKSGGSPAKSHSQATPRPPLFINNSHF